VRQEDSAYLIHMQAFFVISGLTQTQFKGVVAHPLAVHLARTILNSHYADVSVAYYSTAVRFMALYLSQFHIHHSEILGAPYAFNEIGLLLIKKNIHHGEIKGRTD
jgi:hypothetical protein